jgi:hypothetical protein
MTMPDQPLFLHVHSDSLSPDIREALSCCPYRCVVSSRPVPIDTPVTFQTVVVLSGSAGGDVAPALVSDLMEYVGRDAPFLLAAADQRVLRAVLEAVSLIAAPAGRA